MRRAWHKQPQEERAAGCSLPTTPPALHGGTSEGAGGGGEKHGRREGGFKWIKKGRWLRWIAAESHPRSSGLAQASIREGSREGLLSQEQPRCSEGAAVRVSPGKAGGWEQSGSKWPGRGRELGTPGWPQRASLGSPPRRGGPLLSPTSPAL